MDHRFEGWPGRGQWRRGALPSSVRPGFAHKLSPAARGTAFVSVPGVRGENQTIHGRPPLLVRRVTDQSRTHIWLIYVSRED